MLITFIVCYIFSLTLLSPIKSSAISSHYNLFLLNRFKLVDFEHVGFKFVTYINRSFEMNSKGSPYKFNCQHIFCSIMNLYSVVQPYIILFIRNQHSNIRLKKQSDVQ